MLLAGSGASLMAMPLLGITYGNASVGHRKIKKQGGGVFK